MKEDMKMRRMKKVLSVMLSLCLMIAAFCFAKLNVAAEEPVTYTLKVVDGSWNYQPNYPWDDEVQERELYYMFQEMKDGDKLVISDWSDQLELTLDKKLSNVTIEGCSYGIITAPAFENVYVLNGSKVAFNGDVNGAYVYEESIVNFNNNVNYLEVNAKFPLKANVRVLGTVNHLKAQDTEEVHYEFYNFAAGRLSIEEGKLKTDDEYYSSAPVAESTTTTTPATTTTNSNTSSATDELDDVPKTGDVESYYWLLALAVVCMAGGLYLKKKDA